MTWSWWQPTPKLTLTSPAFSDLSGLLEVGHGPVSPLPKFFPEGSHVLLLNIISKLFMRLTDSGCHCSNSDLFLKSTSCAVTQTPFESVTESQWHGAGDGVSVLLEAGAGSATCQGHTATPGQPWADGEGGPPEPPGNL